jgi:hypothetical protein
MAPAVDKAAELAPIDQRPYDEMLVKIDAGVKVVAGTMLLFGRFPRPASAALAATLVPTTCRSPVLGGDRPAAQAGAADPLPARACRRGRARSRPT